MAAPAILWLLWTGDNPMTATRRQTVEDMRKHAKLEVILVTPKNLQQIIDRFQLPPMHEAYEQLSVTHRSDYLRVFLMAHVGGAYCDIKPSKCNFKVMLDRLNAMDDKQVAGQKVKDYSVVSTKLPQFRRNKKLWKNLFTWCCFFAKPKSVLLLSMLGAVKGILDDNSAALHKNPGVFARHVAGKNNKNSYPITWHQILSDVGHPLQLQKKHAGHTVLFPAGTYIEEGGNCRRYRGIEGDHICGLWIPVGPNSRQIMTQLRRFNCRTQDNLRRETSAKTALQEVKKIMRALAERQKHYRAAYCMRAVPAEELLDRAQDMLDAVRNQGFYVSDDIVICSNKAALEKLMELN